MQEHVHHKLHGHDGSAPILEKANLTVVYTDTICCLLEDGYTLPIDSGTYDGIVMSGGASPGHFAMDAFDEIIRVIKQGGFYAPTSREANLHKVQHSCLLNYFRQKVQQGILGFVLDEVYDNFYSNTKGQQIQGRIQIFKVLKNITG